MRHTQGKQEGPEESQADIYFFLVASAYGVLGRVMKYSEQIFTAVGQSGRNAGIRTYSLLGGTLEFLTTVLALLAKLARWLLDLLGEANL